MIATSRSVLFVLAFTALCVPAFGAEHVVLEATGAEASARGKASLAIEAPSDGRFDVRVQRLAPNADYDLVVGGVSVHTMRTNSGGRAKARFDSRPRGRRAVALAFDPRGERLTVRAAGGQAVLTAMLPPYPDSTTTTTTSTTSTTEPAQESTTTTEPSSETTTTEASPPTTTLTPETTTTLPLTCSQACWASFHACLDGCTMTYCAAFCQVDLGRCLDVCPE